MKNRQNIPDSTYKSFNVDYSSKWKNICIFLHAMQHHLSKDPNSVRTQFEEKINPPPVCTTYLCIHISLSLLHGFDWIECVLNQDKSFNSDTKYYVVAGRK